MFKRWYGEKYVSEMSESVLIAESVIEIKQFPTQSTITELLTSLKKNGNIYGIQFSEGTYRYILPILSTFSRVCVRQFVILSYDIFSDSDSLHDVIVEEKINFDSEIEAYLHLTISKLDPFLRIEKLLFCYGIYERDILSFTCGISANGNLYMLRTKGYNDRTIIANTIKYIISIYKKHCLNHKHAYSDIITVISAKDYILRQILTSLHFCYDALHHMHQNANGKIEMKSDAPEVKEDTIHRETARVVNTTPTIYDIVQITPLDLETILSHSRNIYINSNKNDMCHVPPKKMFLLAGQSNMSGRDQASSLFANTGTPSTYDCAIHNHDEKHAPQSTNSRDMDISCEEIDTTSTKTEYLSIGDDNSGLPLNIPCARWFADDGANLSPFYRDRISFFNSNTNKWEQL